MQPANTYMRLGDRCCSAARLLETYSCSKHNNGMHGGMINTRPSAWLPLGNGQGDRIREFLRAAELDISFLKWSAGPMPIPHVILVLKMFIIYFT